MKIINKHILKEFLFIFFLCIITIVSLYLLIDFFEKIDDLMENNASMSEGFKFFLYKIPFIMYQTTPVAVLLATLLSLGILSRNVEITAMKAGGISVLKITFPIMLASLVISAMSFVIDEYIVPPAKKQVESIKKIRIDGKKQAASFKQNKMWYRGDDNIYSISHLDSKKGIIHGLTIYEIDKDFNVLSRIDAEEAKWLDGKWQITNGTKRQFRNGSIKISAVKNGTAPIDENPEELQITEKIADEMSFTELKDYIAKLSLEGYDATRYIVDLHGKIAFPVINIIMVILGIPFALKTGRHSGIAMGIALSVIIGFSYWIVFAVTASLGYIGAIPPFFAAWSANFMFGIIGILMFMNVRQ
ncbi:MAG: LPS export ABC transporter permease LptG [Deltaproteobacteria bacterium]|nr:LPS export ABC transporter permease LptG [Deltaproteobacteria bacterium]